jgi:hypothetical protein
LHNIAEQLAKIARPDLRVFTKPKQSVVAASDIKEHGLILLPMSHKVVIAKLSGSKPHPFAISLGPCGLSDYKNVFLLPHFVMPKPEQPETAFIEPFWATRRVEQDSHEKGLVNCHIETVMVSTCDVVVDMPWLQRVATKRSIGIPVLCNSRSIKAGEELLWIDDSMPTKKRKEAPVFLKAGAKNKASKE